MFEQRKNEIQARKAEIRESLKNDKEIDLSAVENEIRGLDDEMQDIERREKLAEGVKEIEAGAEVRDRGTVAEIVEKKTEERGENMNREQRGKDLRENRTVTVGSGELLIPQHQAKDIQGTFNTVSSLIDRVKHTPLNGGESFKRAYEKTSGEGNYTGEGQAYATAEPTFGYAEITKSKVTAYAEESEEVAKLPHADYEGVITKGVKQSLRKKITKEILIGDGSTGHLVGIFSDKATAIDKATDLEIAEIGPDTLDEILFAFGGDEDVEDASVLILNKKDVKAFATLRDAQGKKVYDVKTNGNTGTIDGVQFIINSVCGSVAGTSAAGTYCMAYGPLSNYELVTFSDVDVQRSTDYKFKEGMIAHRGSVFPGGNVVAHNGFLRVKKSAAARAAKAAK